MTTTGPDHIVVRTLGDYAECEFEGTKAECEAYAAGFNRAQYVIGTVEVREDNP